MNPATTQSLFGLAIAVLVVLRFARRELRERTIKLATLWIRPAILIVLTLYIVAVSLEVDPAGDGEMTAALIGGAILGAITGIAIVANTRFAPAATANAVLVRGSRATFGIWIGALAVRLIARYVLPHGADPRSQLPLNCGLIALTAVAFVVIAVAFAREIRRYGSAMTSPGSIVPGSMTRQ